MGGVSAQALPARRAGGRFWSRRVTCSSEPAANSALAGVCYPASVDSSLKGRARVWYRRLRQPSRIIGSIMAATRRGDYGYDAPYAPLMFGAVAAVTGTAAVLGWRDAEPRVVVRMTLLFLFFLGNLVSFLYTTRRGKLLEWERILARLQLRGDERVLDIGCGRGAVLTAVARRLTTGRATGIDIWSTGDQSGNAQEVTARNAALEGVADRVAIETGDMRALPFADATFDLVVSSLAIHNLRRKAERRQAVAEGFRVLAPGGRIVLADIRAIATYEGVLRSLGAAHLERRRLSWRFWYGNPIGATTLLTASKPPA
jgi:arsenite methyltransferase